MHPWQPNSRADFRSFGPSRDRFWVRFCDSGSGAPPVIARSRGVISEKSGGPSGKKFSAGDADKILAGAPNIIPENPRDSGSGAPPVSARSRDFRRSKTERLKPAVSDIGLSRKEIHEAREIRDAEEADPGIVRRTVAPVILLPALVDRAVAALTNARSAAEVLEARDLASVAYDAAKKAARLHKAKRAHDDLIAAAYRTQADALAIESEAKRRLADEYDAAQQRGEIARPGNPNFYEGEKLPRPNISAKEIHEAREIRDAEKADPGIVAQSMAGVR